MSNKIIDLQAECRQLRNQVAGLQGRVLALRLLLDGRPSAIVVGPMPDPLIEADRHDLRRVIHQRYRGALPIELRYKDAVVRLLAVPDYSQTEAR